MLGGGCWIFHSWGDWTPVHTITSIAFSYVNGLERDLRQSFYSVKECEVCGKKRYAMRAS